jgi:hypothetical protein
VLRAKIDYKNPNGVLRVSLLLFCYEIYCGVGLCLSYGMHVGPQPLPLQFDAPSPSRHEVQDLSDLRLGLPGIARCVSMSLSSRNLVPDGLSGSRMHSLVQIVDSIEGVTHSLRSSEYHDRNHLWDWVLKAAEVRYAGPPHSLPG